MRQPRLSAAIAAFVCVFCVSALHAQTPASEPLPTIERLRQQFADGKYPELQRQIAKVLALKGEPAKAYDRYELLTLRGETLLRTKSPAPAAESFAAAGKATEDANKKALARATELLIRKSKPAGYSAKTEGKPAAAAAARPTPTVPGQPPAAATAPPAAAGPSIALGKGQVIPILEPADRKLAFAALLSDELAAVQPRLKAVKEGGALPPIIEATKPLADLRAIEIAATGASDETRRLGVQLGDQAHKLISSALRTMSARVEECWRSGSRGRRRWNASSNSWEKAYGLAGLTSVESNDLKGALATCDQIIPVAGELAAVTDMKELLADTREAETLRKRAAEVLNYDYPNEGRYNKQPK